MIHFDKDSIDDEWLELINEFPNIFLEPSPYVLYEYRTRSSKCYNFPLCETHLVNLRNSFECGFGWEQIIREFCTDISKLIDNASYNGHEIYYHTFIVKEKFGQCECVGHFYGVDVDEYWDRYDNILGRLVEKSLNTCEQTGMPGTRRTDKYGKMKTLSDNIAKHLGYKYDKTTK